MTWVNCLERWYSTFNEWSVSSGQARQLGPSGMCSRTGISFNFVFLSFNWGNLGEMVRCWNRDLSAENAESYDLLSLQGQREWHCVCWVICIHARKCMLGRIYFNDNKAIVVKLYRKAPGVLIYLWCKGLFEAIKND